MARPTLPPRRRRDTVEGPAPRRPFHQISTVVEDAWAITEIAENILARLPMNDLLLAQRVSSGWRELISISPVLQELLFMRPRQPGPAQEILPDGTPIRDFNSLLLKHMPMWFSKRKDASNQSVMHAPWARTVSRLMFLRRDASWRRMLLAQPPFTVFEGVQQWHVYGADSLAVGCLEFPDGVRMGLAYDIAVASVEGPSVKSIPVSFYTLMDGRTSYYVRGQKAKNDWEMPERIFGGIDKFTLVTRSDGGRLQLDHETRRKIELQHREYTSVGSELAKIVLRKVPRVVKYPGSLYAWWTDDGYIKANE